jgi:hypothetical protein
MQALAILVLLVESLEISDAENPVRENTRPYRYHGLKIFTSLKLRFQDFQRLRFPATLPFAANLGLDAQNELSQK